MAQSYEKAERIATSKHRPRLVILGTGFASFSLLRRIDSRAYDVTVVSPRNHFLFTPLLPSTTVGTIEFRAIIEPVRPGRPNLRFCLATAESIDFTTCRVLCRSCVSDASWEQPYDCLAIGVGCVTNTFGTPGVCEHAFFLKELTDARRIRQRLIDNLELASLPGVTEEEQDRLLHFVAVGAGPTGIRFAAELYDLLVNDLPRSYPHLTPRVRVTLLDAGPSLLSSYDQELQDYVAGTFRRRGIGVRTESPVSEVGPGWVRLKNGETIPTAMVLWCAGFTGNPFLSRLNLESDRIGRLVTDEFLQVVGAPGVYAFGDCACPANLNLPQMAQVAEQQGRYLADSLNHRARGMSPRPFRWRNRGMASYIGLGAAVIDSPRGGSGRSGFWAYQQWRAAIWTQLVSVRNKVIVPLDRLRTAVFGRDLSRF